MGRSFVREQRYQCAGEYMVVRLCRVTDEEHRGRRRKKERESTPRQKSKNAEAARQHRLRVALANFSRAGYYVTLTYEDPFLPPDSAAARRDLRNWMRRVIAAARRELGLARGAVRYMGITAAGSKTGRLHHHVMVQCDGLSMRQAAAFRTLLEDKWSSGRGEQAQPMGWANADRLQMQHGLEDLISYFCSARRHPKRWWYQSRNLEMPVALRPNDSRWSQKELHTACGECAQDAYYWGQKYPGWDYVGSSVIKRDPLAEGWAERDLAERGCYVILHRRCGMLRNPAHEFCAAGKTRAPERGGGQ